MFPWIDGFIPDLEELGAGRTHSLKEFEASYGPGYLPHLPWRGVMGLVGIASICAGLALRAGRTTGR